MDRRTAAPLVIAILCAAVSIHAQSPDLKVRPTYDLVRPTYKAAAERVAGPDAHVCDVVPWSGTAANGTFLMSVDYSGRGFCNTLFLVRTGRYGRILQEIPVWQLNDLSTALVDLDADGRRELIVSSLLTDYDGVGCTSLVPVIYACTTARCTDSGTKFLAYLQAQLTQQEAALAPLTADEIARGKNVCSVVTRDKLRRMLGVDRRAGFDAALQWIESGDELLAIKGLTVLNDIADEEALAKIETVSGGTGPVAERAKELRGQKFVSN